MPPKKRRNNKKKKKKDQHRHAESSHASVAEHSENGSENEGDGISPKTPVKNREEEADSRSSDTETESSTQDSSTNDSRREDIPAADLKHNHVEEATVNVPGDEKFENIRKESADVEEEGASSGVKGVAESSYDSTVGPENSKMEEEVSGNTLLDNNSSQTEQEQERKEILETTSSWDSGRQESDSAVQDSEEVRKSNGETIEVPFDSAKISAADVNPDPASMELGMEEGKVLHDPSPLKAAVTTDLNPKQESLETAKNLASYSSDGDESKVDDASCMAIVDVNESVQSLGSVETPRSVDFASQESENEAVIGTPWEEIKNQDEGGKDVHKRNDDQEMFSKNDDAIYSCQMQPIIADSKPVERNDDERNTPLSIQQEISDFKSTEEVKVDLESDSHVLKENQASDITVPGSSTMEQGSSAVESNPPALAATALKTEVTETESKAVNPFEGQITQYISVMPEAENSSVKEEIPREQFPLLSQDKKNEGTIVTGQRTSWMSCCGIFDILRLSRSSSS